MNQYQWLLKDHEAGAAIPTLRPLAVGDVLLIRTLRKLLAVDIATGERLWAAPPDDETESKLDADSYDQGRGWPRPALSSERGTT